MVAAAGRELNAPVVSGDGDPTHKATKDATEIEECLD